MSKLIILSHRDIRHSDAGGASLYVHEIFKRLATKHMVTIVSTAKRGLPSKEKVDGIDIVRIPFPRVSRLTIPLTVVTRLAGKADALIDNGDVALPWLSPLYSRKPLLSIVYQVVGNIFDYELTLPLASLAKTAERWVYRMYARTNIVTCSPSTEDDLVRLGVPRSKITVIRPGIDNWFLSGDRKGKTAEPTIVCVSRFKRYKGLHYAVQAMGYVLKRIPNARLIIVGSGDSSEVLDEIERANLGSHVNLIQRKPHTWDQEKKGLLSSAHVALVPSIREGYGIVVIEANACGTVAVGWKVPGLQDSIKDGSTGFLVSFDDVEQLADKICRLLQDSDLRTKMEGNAIEWARTHSWDKAAESFENVIDAMI